MAIRARPRKDGTIAWFFDFMHNGRRYRGVGGTTKTQAMRTLDKVRSQVISGEYELVERPRNPVIDEFAKLFLQRRTHLKSSSRDELSARTLLRYFKGMSLGCITPANIEDYISDRRKQGVCGATINRELACLKRMYNLAIRWGDARKNPVMSVDFQKESPGRTRYLSLEEITGLLEASSEALRPIVFTALYTGMRLRELLSLKWTQVFIDNVIDPYIEIKKTKNDKTRIVPISDDLVGVLRSIRDNHPEQVFIGERGRPLLTVKRPFETALRKSGIRDFRFHDLRHTFASYFIMNGGDLLALKEILGHSTLKMVERYAHLASSHKRRQVNNMKGIFADCHLFVTCEASDEMHEKATGKITNTCAHSSAG